MIERLISPLNGKETNYLHPFTGVGGDEGTEELRTRFLKLRDAGIYSMILLYNGSSDGTGKKQSSFGDEWWALLERVSAVCRELGMTYWIQDAAPFPTGAANGLFTLPEYRDKGKVYLAERHTNVRGPRKNASILAGHLTDNYRGWHLEAQYAHNTKGDKPLYAVAVRRASEGGAFDLNTAMNLTNKLKDGFLQYDVPEGDWRVFFFYESRTGGRKHYMNLLDADSVAVQIEGTHAPHYERLKGELGRTWMGFFYDEPEVGNVPVPGYDFNVLPGAMPNDTPITLPWSREMPALLKERLGESWAAYLPALFYDCGGMTGVIRYHFMDAVTSLITENYNGQVWDWCRRRGIGYMGHVLEDEGSHARLGCGAGHFFRVQRYQDTAGIDLIAGQILPGMDSYGTSWFGAPDADGAFYHYGLAKLASSEAHINPCKQGRSICEALGVYGYIATAKYAKFILDHLFVNGVNNVIPAGLDHLPTEHAKRLWDYANRMCRLMDGSEHIAPAAILYHAEAEWAGEYQPFHHPAKELAKNQIDYDIIPCDALTDGGYYRAVLDGRKLGINRESYSALVVPYCARIPKAAAAFIGKAKDQGLPVYFVEGLPEGYCDCFERIGNELEGCEAVPLNALASRLRSEGIAEIKADSSEPFLRYNHFIKDGIHCLMFHNEEPERDINTVVWISAEETDGIVRYDAMDGVIRPAQTVHDNGRIGISLNLRQYEAAVYFIGNALESRAAGVCGGISEEIQPERWRVTLDPGGPDERSIILKQLCDLSAPDMFPGFGGLLKYATAFTLDTIPSDDRPCFLDLGNACDSAQVILNGKRLELRIAAPYTFDISGAVKAGRNELIAEVYTNPARSGADKLGSRPGAEGFFAAAYSALEPSGLLGPLSIAYEKA